MRNISLLQRCAHVLAAVLVWLLPVAIHAQDVDQSPVNKLAGEPKIVFESQAHDFGTVQPNAPLTHSFVFTNQGAAPLLIEKVKAG
jgi:hypothetical protein